jgi:hypothetical protein
MPARGGSRPPQSKSRAGPAPDYGGEPATGRCDSALSRHARNRKTDDYGHGPEVTERGEADNGRRAGLNRYRNPL